MPDIRTQIKTLGSFLADLVFPIYCLVCKKEGQFLCNDCYPKLTRLDKQLCIVCQKPAPFGKTHQACISKNKLDGIISCLNFKDPNVARIIEIYKYKFIKDLGPKFSLLIQEAIKNQGLENYFQNFVVVPVPLHKRRLAWRGFNQSELIARELANDLNLNLNTEIVTRQKYTKPQTTLAKEARSENIQDAFISNNGSDLKFLLIDDVITTGATLNELAKILKKSGASDVWAATIAHG